MNILHQTYPLLVLDLRQFNLELLPESLHHDGITLLTVLALSRQLVLESCNFLLEQLGLILGQSQFGDQLTNDLENFELEQEYSKAKTIILPCSFPFYCCPRRNRGIA